MAIVPLHKGITKEVLRDLGFTDEAAERAAQANAKVDDKQGNDVAETHLHAMAGYQLYKDPVLRADQWKMEGKDEAEKAVSKLLATAKSAIVKAILNGNHDAALKALGEALHTVQDRSFHGFEPWPYQGIGEAAMRAPNYMFGHGVRDVGRISKLEMRQTWTGPRLAAEWTEPLTNNAFISIQGFHQAAMRPMQFPGPLGKGADPLGSGFLVSLTFGTAPGSARPPTRLEPDGRPSSDDAPYWLLAVQGPAARAAATTASREFVTEIKMQVQQREGGAQAWGDFVKLRKSKL